MITFNNSRPDFAPYGFTCEHWTPVPMERADRHNEIELNLLKRGTLTYLIGGNKVTIPAGRLAVFWASVPHQIIAASDDAEYYVVTLPLVWFLQCQFPAYFVDAVMHARMYLDPDPEPHPCDLEMFECWVHDLEKNDAMRKRVAFLEIEARLMRFALSFPDELRSKAACTSANLKPETVAMGSVERMAAFIALHYTEHLTVEQIGRATGICSTSAMTLFKKAMGITLIDCVTQHRISHAQRLLATTDLKILDVALSSGFPSQSRFYEAFHKWSGCLPSDWRRNNGPTEPPQIAKPKETRKTSMNIKWVEGRSLRRGSLPSGSGVVHGRRHTSGA